MLDFHYSAIQFNRLDWRDFLVLPNPVASALMAKMQIAPKDRPLVKAECLRMMVNLPLDEARTQLLSGFVDTYLRLDSEEQAIFQEQVADFAPQEEEQAMQIMTSWKLEGIEVGRKEGRNEGERAVLYKILRRRCGELPEETLARLNILSVVQLEDLADAVLDFTHRDDLNAWLDANTSL